MGAVAATALAATLGVALLLFRHRGCAANMRSVWICPRNDAIGNLAVGLATIGVLGSGTAWPDALVAAFMAVSAITGSATVLRQALAELHGSLAS